MRVPQYIQRAIRNSVEPSPYPEQLGVLVRGRGNKTEAERIKEARKIAGRIITWVQRKGGHGYITRQGSMYVLVELSGKGATELVNYVRRPTN